MELDNTTLIILYWCCFGIFEVSSVFNASGQLNVRMMNCTHSCSSVSIRKYSMQCDCKRRRYRTTILLYDIVALRLLAPYFNLLVEVLMLYLAFQRICLQELYYSTGIFSHSAHFEAVYLRTLRHIFCSKAIGKSFREIIAVETCWKWF